MDPIAVIAQLSTEDMASLRGVVDDWVRFSLAADWDRFVGLLTDDVVFLPPDQPIVNGKQAIREWLDISPRIRGLEAALTRAEGRADLASAFGMFRMILEPVPGTRLSLTGKWAATFRKQADGRWLCASDAWNTDHPVAAA